MSEVMNLYPFFIAQPDDSPFGEHSTLVLVKYCLYCVIFQPYCTCCGAALGAGCRQPTPLFPGSLVKPFFAFEVVQTRY